MTAIFSMHTDKVDDGIVSKCRIYAKPVKIVINGPFGMKIDRSSAIINS